jgi:Excreted virulence factor EspC, type VII ESX diderm
MMTEDLRVDTGLVRQAGGRLQGIAADIPEPPTAYRPTAADALSSAIAAKVTEVVDPVLAQMPIAKEALTRYAQNVVNAANTYEAADRQLGEEIIKRVEAFDDKFGGGGADDGGAAVPGGAGAAPSSAATASPTVGGAVSAATAAAGAGQPSGQLGQMMQTPMQMGQQAAQAPMQAAGMAGGLVQAVQQGAQQDVQQATQFAEETTTEPHNASKASEDAEPGRDEAAAGLNGGERTPESLAPGPSETSDKAEDGPVIAL